MQASQTNPVLPPLSDHDLICKSDILNISNFKIPTITPENKHKLRVHCPQIRKSIIQIPIVQSIISYVDLSRHIVSQLGLEESLKAILYNRYGQPFLYNLDLMYLPLPKLDYSQEMSVLFTATASAIDTPIKKPEEPENNISKIFVMRDSDKFEISVDLDNTLNCLKYKIFEQSKYHPSNQIIKFATKPLLNSVQSLKTYGIIEGSILELSFKLSSNLMPATFADKFYYKDIKHIRQQTQQGLCQFRSTLLTLAAHLTADDKLKVVTFIRALTHNLPLAFALKTLFNNNFVSQTHRIAIEQGVIVALTDYLRNCTPTPDAIQFKQLFTKFRDFIGYVLEGSLKITLTEEIKSQSEFVEIQRNCHFTMVPIIKPRLIKLDNAEYVLIDGNAFEEQILKGFTFPLLKAPKKQQIICENGLQEYYYLYLINQLDNPGTNSLFWFGFKPEHPQINLPNIGAVDLYRNKLESYPELKLHQPLQVKNKSSVYLLLKNKQGALRIFISKNKDISRPFNLFNVITGSEQAVNLDLMNANVTSESVQEVIDVSNMKAVITRDPKQAIAVLFDVSGSMSSGFFNEPDLKRIGAVKSFFEAFAYRTIAYNLQHVVSLFFFDHTVENQCGFTEAIYDFNRLISKAAPRGSTMMYDAIVVAANSLREFGKKYPQCVLRIVALTDGEDTGSKHSIEETTNIIIDNKIVIDSFAVGANCDGLKIISKASGGKCYMTRNLEESLKLFEQETVLSVRARKLDQSYLKLPVAQRIEAARWKPFDLPSTVHEFKMPESKGGISAKQMAVKMQSVEGVQKIGGNNSLKRIAKEIQHYSENPHPFVAIFPCSNMNIWKILLLGPKETPYENGLFLLYAQFPEQYPFKAPQVRFITPIYHCNMNSQGRICHSVFDRNYSPAISFRQIIDCVYGLILTPEPEDPLDNVVASFYLSDYQTYLKNAKNFTQQKASASIEQTVDQLFGKIVDDSQRKQKEKEIEEWIVQAKSFN